MEEHVKRLVVERDELSDKLKKLSEFMKSDTFKKLDEDDKMINSQSAFLHSDFLCQFQWVTTYFFARY